MTPASSSPSLADLTRVSARIGVLSFGGPAAQIALMHREFVETRNWVDEETYLRALSLCMLLPGPEAMQLATYMGWKLRGTRGGLIAGTLFVLPGALVIALLALGYVSYGNLPLVQAAFLGIKAAVIIIVVQALIKLSQKALARRDALWLAGLAFLGIFALDLPFPLIIVAAGLWGFWRAQERPSRPPQNPTPSATQSVRTVALWGALWLLPLGVLTLAGQSFLSQIGAFFAFLAVISFGGAYALLAYMTQTVVQDYGWITTAQMIDALGLAETTPGPLILVTEFVALLAGYAQGGVGLALAAAMTALWATFVPCFLWIFLAGPYLEQIASRPRLSGALHAITAAVVGVILNLSLWFALHVWFGQVGQLNLGFAQLAWPEWQTLNGVAVLLTVLAGGMFLGLRWGLAQVLAVIAGAAIVFSWL